MWRCPFAQRHQHAVTSVGFARLSMMWVFNIGFSSVSAVSTSCLKCEKVLLTLQLVDHQVQALPDANDIGALLQGKKMPPEAQDLRIIGNIDKKSADVTETCCNNTEIISEM